MVFSSKAPAENFFDHIDELRNRILRCLLAVAITSVVFYNYIDVVLSYIISPIGKLVFTSPADAFLARMHLTIFGGIVLALPYLLYEIWSFVAGALQPHERKFILVFGPFSFILFIVGGLFAYSVVIPVSLNFFMSFASETMQPMINVRSYLSFMLSLMLSFGVVFELPFILLFLTKIGVATPAFLVQKRRYAIVFILIVSMIMTPPDVISLFMMALPMIVLYEIGIWVSKITLTKELQLERS